MQEGASSIHPGLITPPPPPPRMEHPLLIAVSAPSGTGKTHYVIVLLRSAPR